MCGGQLQHSFVPPNIGFLLLFPSCQSPEMRYRPKEEASAKTKLDHDFSVSPLKTMHKCSEVYCLEDPESPMYSTKSSFDGRSEPTVLCLNPTQQYGSEEFRYSGSFSFYDEIRTIWRKSGFRRHKKPTLVDKKMEPKNMDFSFSPYDNFF